MTRPPFPRVASAALIASAAALAGCATLSLIHISEPTRPY